MSIYNFNMPINKKRRDITKELLQSLTAFKKEKEVPPIRRKPKAGETNKVCICCKRQYVPKTLKNGLKLTRLCYNCYAHRAKHNYDEELYIL